MAECLWFNPQHTSTLTGVGVEEGQGGQERGAEEEKEGEKNGGEGRGELYRLTSNSMVQAIPLPQPPV